MDLVRSIGGSTRGAELGTGGHKFKARPVTFSAAILMISRKRFLKLRSCVRN